MHINISIHDFAQYISNCLPYCTDCNGKIKLIIAERFDTDYMFLLVLHVSIIKTYNKLSYCWETERRKSMPRIAEMDVEMTT